MSYTSPAPPIHDHSFKVQFDEINEVPYTRVANTGRPRDQDLKRKSWKDNTRN